MKSLRRNRKAGGWRVEGRGWRQASDLRPSTFNKVKPGAYSPERGFSLIELLIASVIIASAGAMLIGALVAANRGADLYGEHALDTQLLASRLALLEERVNKQMPMSGTFDPPLDDVEWRLEVSEAPPPLAPLAQVVISVERNGAHSDVVTHRQVVEP